MSILSLFAEVDKVGIQLINDAKLINVAFIIFLKNFENSTTD